MVRDPVLVKSEGYPGFEDVAFSSVKDFRYAPRFVDGEPVMVKGVQNKFTFKINNRTQSSLQGPMDSRSMDPMRPQRGG